MSKPGDMHLLIVEVVKPGLADIPIGVRGRVTADLGENEVARPGGVFAVYFEQPTTPGDSATQWWTFAQEHKDFFKVVET